jgi:hypothetical protein
LSGWSLIDLSSFIALSLDDVRTARFQSPALLNRLRFLLSPSMHNTKKDGYEEKGSDRGKQESADHGASQRRILLAALA